MPNINDVPTDKLSTSILKLDETVAYAYAHIQQLFTEYEGNIDQILERLRDKNLIQEGEEAGRDFTQQQYSDQKIYNQLLLDQNKAFSEFNIALQQIIEKLDPTSRAAKMKDTTNFAHNNGMTVEEVSFYRKLGNYHQVDQQHADQNEQKLKRLFDLRKTPDALEKDPMIAALKKFDPEILKKLGNAKDLTEFIPMLIQAMAEANKQKDTNKNAANAVKAGKEFLGNNDALWALWTDLSIQFIDQQKMKDMRSSKDKAPERYKSKVFNAKSQAEEDGHGSGDINNIAEENAGHQNAADTSLNAGMASLAQSIIAAINKKTNEINDSPTFKGEDAATQMGIQKAIDRWKEIEPLFTGLEDFLGVFGGGGGKGVDPASAVKAFGIAVQGAMIAVDGWTARLTSKEYFNKQSLNTSMTMTEEQVNTRLKDMKAQSDNPNNKRTMDYYDKDKGITFTQNYQTLDFQAYKDGKLIAPTVKSLDEITRSLQWIQDPKHKEDIAKMEKRTGLKVDINLETGKLALVDKEGQLAANLGFTHGSNRAQSFFTDDQAPVVDGILQDYLRKKTQEKLQKEKEAKQKQLAAENAKLREDMKDKVSGQKIIFPDAPVPLPAPQKVMLPTIDENLVLPILPINIEKISRNNRSANGQNRKPVSNKRPSAADIKMAKECSHIENSNNSYKYDVKITVNPPSGDPIKIAQQVCEQLKRHTCGSEQGFSKSAASRQLGNH